MKKKINLNSYTDETLARLSNYVVEMMKTHNIKELTYDQFRDLQIMAVATEAVEIRLLRDELMEAHQIPVNVIKACAIRKAFPQFRFMSTEEMLQQPWWPDYTTRAKLKK